MWSKIISRWDQKKYKFSRKWISRQRCPTVEFYKFFCIELTPAFLDVYESCWKLGTIAVTCRTEIISIVYKNGDKKDDWWLQTLDSYNLDFLRIDCKKDEIQ